MGGRKAGLMMLSPSGYNSGWRPNGHKPKRPHTKTVTNQNGRKSVQNGHNVSKHL